MTRHLEWVRSTAQRKPVTLSLSPVRVHHQLGPAIIGTACVWTPACARPGVVNADTIAGRSGFDDGN